MLMRELKDQERRKAARVQKEAAEQAELLATLRQQAENDIRGQLEAKLMADQVEFERQRVAEVEAVVDLEAERKRMVDEVEAERKRVAEIDTERQRLADQLKASKKALTQREAAMSKLEKKIKVLQDKSSKAEQEMAAVQDKSAEDREVLETNNDLIAKECVAAKKELAAARACVEETTRERDHIQLLWQTHESCPTFEQLLRSTKRHVTGDPEADTRRPQESLEEVTRFLADWSKAIVVDGDMFTQKRAAAFERDLRRWRIKRNEITHGSIQLDVDGHQEFQKLTRFLTEDLKRYKEQYDFKRALEEEKKRQYDKRAREEEERRQYDYRYR